jgi:hypothetical protein
MENMNMFSACSFPGAAGLSFSVSRSAYSGEQTRAGIMALLTLIYYFSVKSENI